MKAVLREDIIRNIVHRKSFAAAEKELGYCRRNSIAAIASTDPEFPALLREIPDYPHVLYLKGNAAALSARCVAMVGTRRANALWADDVQQAGGGARSTGSGALHRERAGVRHRRRGTPGSPGRRGTNRRGTGEPAPRRHAGTTHGRGARHPRPRRGTGHGAPLADAAERHGIPGPQPDHRRAGCRLRGRRVARQRRVARHGRIAPTATTVR